MRNSNDQHLGVNNWEFKWFYLLYKFILSHLYIEHWSTIVLFQNLLVNPGKEKYHTMMKCNSIKLLKLWWKEKDRTYITHVDKQQISVCPYCNVSISRMEDSRMEDFLMLKKTMYYPFWLFLLPTESQRCSRGNCRTVIAMQCYLKVFVIFTIMMGPGMHQIHIKAKCGFKYRTGIQVRGFFTGFWWRTIQMWICMWMFFFHLNVLNICAMAESSTECCSQWRNTISI